MILCLKNGRIRKKCSNDFTEEEVQSFRDVYNLLAIGNPNKLVKIEPENMEKFLEFGTELWLDAIKGFEKGKVENCVEVDNPSDPRDREDCRFDEYYRQDGYWSGGAASALEWIAKSNWLAKLLTEHDEDYLIMTALLKTLSEGGGAPKEKEEYRKASCNLADIYEENWDGDNQHDKGSGDINEDINADNTPNEDSDAHGRLDPDNNTQGSRTAVTVAEEKLYKVFGADCVKNSKIESSVKSDEITYRSSKEKDRNRGSYMLLSVLEDNEDSIKLGHQFLKEKLCAANSNTDDCVKYFYCNIKEGGKKAAIEDSQRKVVEHSYIRKTIGWPDKTAGWSIKRNYCLNY